MRLTGNYRQNFIKFISKFIKNCVHFFRLRSCWSYHENHKYHIQNMARHFDWIYTCGHFQLMTDWKLPKRHVQKEDLARSRNLRLMGVFGFPSLLILLLITLFIAYGKVEFKRFQWCWWQIHVFDLVMVTVFRFWFQNHYFMFFFVMLLAFYIWYQHWKSVTNN